MRRIAGGLGLALASAAVISACTSSAQVIVVNRTTVGLALLPGVIVPACGKAEFTKEQIQAGTDRFVFGDLEDWVPEGAVEYTVPWVPRRAGDTRPDIILVTSAGAEAGGLFVPGVEPCEGEPPPLEE